MKQLPEAARAIVESARDAHDPSEAQLQSMLAKLHTQLGYTETPASPATKVAVDRGRGVLQAKLLKLALSLAAIGGITVWVAPHSPATIQQPLPIVAAPEAPHNLEPEPDLHGHVDLELSTATPTDTPNSPQRAKAQSPAAGGAGSSRRAVAAARVGKASAVLPRDAADRSAAPVPESSAAQARSAAERGAQANAAVSSHTSTRVQPGLLPASGEPAAPARADAAPEKVLLSDDVVPLGAARERAQAKARAASDADGLRLIDRAASLLRDGEPEDALELLQEHDRKFPASQLKLERRGLSVLARCGAGQVEQGRRERAEFLREAGTAPIAARVRRACPETLP
ncbi:MAG TPA: hypothetical protein VFN67_42635 [Polyangiales bacterium]|nr:hypothetical protein [Polyangiales bacterium]